jgi:hypothetical protein
MKWPIHWEAQSANNHTKINDINKTISVERIGSKFNKFSKRKHQMQIFSIQNSTKYLKKKLCQFSTIFQKIKAEWTIPSSFYEVRITLIPSQIRTIKGGKIQTNLSEHRYKNSQQNFSKLDQTSKIHHNLEGLIAGRLGCFNIWVLVNHSNRLKPKNIIKSYQ